MDWDYHEAAEKHGAAWKSAASLADLGELTAQWLEGSISYIPSDMAPGPDPETDDLAHGLAAFNRMGFVTDCSQPGVALANGEGQRACVWGYAAEDVAQTLARACLATDLVCVATPPGTPDGPWLPVTIYEELAYTWVPPPTTPSDLVGSWREALSVEGLVALVEAWQVNIFDPVWGRNDLLWDVVKAALEGPTATGALPPGAH